MHPAAPAAGPAPGARPRRLSGALTALFLLAETGYLPACLLGGTRWGSTAPRGPVCRERPCHRGKAGRKTVFSHLAFSWRSTLFGKGHLCSSSSAMASAGSVQLGLGQTAPVRGCRLRAREVIPLLTPFQPSQDLKLQLQYNVLVSLISKHQPRFSNTANLPTLAGKCLTSCTMHSPKSFLCGDVFFPIRKDQLLPSSTALFLHA